jgi:hypothetical protein
MITDSYCIPCKMSNPPSTLSINFTPATILQLSRVKPDRQSRVSELRSLLIFRLGFLYAEKITVAQRLNEAFESSMEATI